MNITIRDRCRECPRCKSQSANVVDSRLRADGYIYRRRKCTGCGARWTTIEIPEEELDKIFGKFE